MAGWGQLAKLGLTLTCGALAGCALLSDDTPVAAPQALPVAFKNAKPPTAQLPPPTSEWWKDFHNDELNHLIATALTNNHDLRVAITRITQTEAQATVAGAAQFPTLSADLNQANTAPYFGVGTASNGSAPWASQRLPEASLKASYEVDLWGKNAASAKSALALAQASVYYREVVGLTLTSDLTKAYFDYLAENDRTAVAERNVVIVKESLKAVRTRMEQGDATINEVMQQETALATAQAAVPVHRLNRERAFDKLAALMGTTPAELSLHGKTLAGIEMPKINTGIPAQLICRRPDIRRAEANMLSAHADIQVARAKMYPDLTFSLQGGVGAYAYSSLLGALPQSRFYSIIGDLTQSIFDAGQLAAGVQLQRAKYEEMVETYRQTIIESVHDVEDALAAVRLLGEQQKSLAEAAANAKQAHDLARVSFDRGAVDYLMLLESERSLDSSEDAEIAARDDRLKASVDLFKALGGGLEDPHC